MSGGSLEAALWALTGVALALPVSFYVMRRLRRSGRWARGAGVASALFFSFDFYNGRNRSLVEETEDEGKRKKDERSGDPPSPDVKDREAKRD